MLTQAVTDVNGSPGFQVESFVNGYSFSTLDIFGFTTGNLFSAGDVINLNTNSWATSVANGLFSGGTDLGLTDNFGANITTHGADATMALYNGMPGDIIPTNFQVLLDSLATYTSFNNFVSSLESPGLGDIAFNAIWVPGTSSITWSPLT